MENCKNRAPSQGKVLACCFKKMSDTELPRPPLSTRLEAAVGDSVSSEDTHNTLSTPCVSLTSPQSFRPDKHGLDRLRRLHIIERCLEILRIVVLDHLLDCKVACFVLLDQIWDHLYLC